MKKLDTSPYKGVRDFYPEDMFLLKYIFKKMRQTAESFGYVEYGASILEPSELYQVKSGEEIVNEQTYNFTDRGGRGVTLRPEMTPTVSRMVAAKIRDLATPLRWYSIPNLFRYERPQKGRLREHYQLNVDLFGVNSEEGDIEILKLARQLLINLGAKDSDFEILINSRKILNAVFEKFNLNDDERYRVSKIIDKKSKMTIDDFKGYLQDILGEKGKDFTETLESNKKMIELIGEENPIIKELTSLIDNLSKQGVKVRFDQYLIRGFDYYTGFVFEIYDTSEENRRSLFGGGRYDHLLEVFGQSVPAVGFGAGDVTIIDFLQTHKLIPDYKSTVHLYITNFGNTSQEIEKLSYKLRSKGINVAIDISDKKVADKLKVAVKQKIPFFLCIGDDEIKSKQYKVKNLETGEEKTVKTEEIEKFLNLPNF